VATDSSTPFTESTADVGGGAGGVGGVAGVVPPLLPDLPELPEPLEPLDPPELEEPDDDELLDCGPSESNGSLLANRENDWSWPVSADGLTAAISWVPPAIAVPAVGSDVEPLADGSGVETGAAATGVDGAGVVLVEAVVVAACGFEAGLPPMPDIVLYAYAAASTNKTASPMSIFFCLAAFAFAASATAFFAMVAPFVAD
jgi:hypothetical protein